MFRFIFVAMAALILPFAAVAQAGRDANQVSIVALVITSGERPGAARSITKTLEALDAQILSINTPATPQIRLILNRFAAAALNSEVALVYYDGAVLEIDGRAFIAPGGGELRRRSDLLTRAIPLAALARATALAANGGAVLVRSSGQDIALISGVTLLETAPPARIGTSPVLFADASAAMLLDDGMEAMLQAQGDIDLSDVLHGLAEIEGISLSQPPAGSTLLRRTAPVASATLAGTASNPVADAQEAKPAQGMALPQVGNETTGTAPDTPLTAASDPAQDDSGTSGEETAETATQPDEAFSLERLKAMQAALTPAQKQVIQRHLRNLGFYTGVIDGSFGPQTEQAIASYQGSISAEVTGVLTPEQTEALSE